MTNLERFALHVLESMDRSESDPLEAEDFRETAAHLGLMDRRFEVTEDEGSVDGDRGDMVWVLVPEVLRQIEILRAVRRSLPFIRPLGIGDESD